MGCRRRRCGSPLPHPHRAHDIIAESEGSFPAGNLCLGHVTVADIGIGSEVACPVRVDERWVSHSSRVVGRVRKKGSVPPPHTVGAALEPRVDLLHFSSVEGNVPLLFVFDSLTQAEIVYINPLPLSTMHRSLDTVPRWVISRSSTPLPSKISR